eukprot:TRINITY_DN1715_c0_g1_i6.p1 TRINITY_DN1715_c0_g1~~TRINITY_DN1715_c0_g1_i6.p1  ORF type:complete len:1860 (+),score=520.28 TRINITY_DN1715_c0_g1_i6:90-5669(+)
MHTTFVEVRQEQQRSAFVDSETAAASAALAAEENKDENIIDRIANREAPNPTCVAPFDTIQPLVTTLVDSKLFEAVVNTMIILSVGIQVYEASGSGNVDDGLIQDSEIVFIAFFSIESTLRFVKFGTPNAFVTKDGWNTFDLCILILTIIGLIARKTTFRFFRAFRLLRVISMAKDMEGLQRLLAAAVAGIIPTVNVLIFSLFILFVFSCMGMSLFGGHFNRHHQPNSPFVNNANTQGWLDVIDRLNFDKFETAFILLFQIMTGDNWSQFMWYSMNIDIPLPWLQGSVFFVVYYFISGLIILSLFTVVILENFELSQEEKQQATQRLRKNIEKAMRVGIQARRSLGLSAAYRDSGSRPVQGTIDLDPVMLAIKQRMGALVQNRRQTILPLRLPISTVLLHIAQHHNDSDLEDSHDVLEQSLAGLNPALHDQNMLNWITATHTFLSSAFLYYRSQSAVLLHNILVKTVKEQLQQSILQTLEAQLMKGLGVGQNALVSVVEVEWGTEGKSEGVVNQLARLGKAPDQGNVKSYKTMVLYEVCLAEAYARKKQIDKEASERLLMVSAFNSSTSWDMKDVHMSKIQSVVRRFLVKKNFTAMLNLMRQERTVRELIADKQHTEWHNMALGSVAPLPELKCKVRDIAWENPLGQDRKTVTPQKYYKGLLEFKRKFMRKDLYGVDVEGLASTYEVDEGPKGFREILQLILNGDFVVATHKFMENDKSTLGEAFLRTRKYAKEALKVSGATFADVYLRSAYNMHLESFEFSYDTASEVSGDVPEIQVAVPDLLMAPNPEGAFKSPRAAYKSPRGSRVVHNPLKWVDPDLTMAKSGYCAFCTHYVVNGDTVHHVTASRATALRPSSVASMSPTVMRSPQVGYLRKPSVSFAAFETIIQPKQRISQPALFGISPPSTPTTFSPGYKSPPGIVNDDDDLFSPAASPVPRRPRRRVVLNDLPHDCGKESLVREITNEISRDPSRDNDGEPTTGGATAGGRESPDNKTDPGDRERLGMTKSFGLFTPDHQFRILCERISRSIVFNIFITAVIIASSIVVLWQPTPEAWDKTPKLPVWMKYLDTGFIFVFIVEAGIKMVATTFYEAGDDSYLGDSWNKLDFLVLWCQIVAFLLPTVKVLGLIKALRPLRLISQFDGLQVVLGALLASLKTFVNVFIAGTFFLFLCALVGYHLFHDRFNRCTNPSWTGGEPMEECVGTNVSTVDDVSYLVPVAWIPSQTATFDTIQAAMATCLEISSLSSWSSVAYQSMDITDIGKQPKTNNSIWAIVYFIIVITICTLFLVNLFIGVIITNINTHRGMELMDGRQQEWALLNRTLSLVRLPVVINRPQGGCLWGAVRRWCFDISENPKFLSFVLGVIVINIFVMASASRNEPDEYSSVRDILNYVFLTVYTVEMIVKLLAYGQKYFSDHWNRFDFVIVWGSLLSIAYSVAVNDNTLTVLSVARIFRIGRIFRLARRFKGVSTMFHTLIVSLPQILNISLMMLLLIFIYTVIGMSYFSHIKYQYALNRNANFRSFSSALSIVFRMVTLDDWNKVMRDCTVQPPSCTNQDGIDDCGSRWAFVYFFSFFIIGSYIFLNLVIAVILDNFSHTFSRSKQHITDHDIAVFMSTWMEHDPQGKGFLPRYKLSDFTLSLLKNECSIATQSCFHPVEFSMRYKALLYELDLMSAEKVKSAKFQFFKRTALEGSIPVVYFEDVLMVMCRAYHGFPGLTFDELNERAAKEVFWEVSLGVGVLARATRMCLGLKQAKQEVNDQEKWAALERIRLNLQNLQRTATAVQQEKLQILYTGYARSRYEVGSEPDEATAGWASELERVPRDGAWSAISLAAIYAPPCRAQDFEAGQEFIRMRARRSSSFRL